MTRVRPPVIAAIAVSILVLGAAVVFTVIRASAVNATRATVSEDASAATESDGARALGDTPIIETSLLLVHVVGAVQASGVYELKSDARVIDAIEAAGGARDDAALTSVNLARLVSDGEQLRIPTVAEAALSQSVVENSPAASGASPSATGSLININVASAAQLEDLPGVGPALASRIIDYRTANGQFRSIDNLNDVSGIGDKLLDQIRQYVTI